jgi:hypothetical protein
MTMRLSLSAVALLVGIGVAFAQSPPPTPAQQPQDHVKSQQGGKEEPSSHIPTTATTEVFVNGKLAVPGAPKDSQTEPAKFSERNAKLDLEPLVKGQPARTAR